MTMRYPADNVLQAYIRLPEGDLVLVGWLTNFTSPTLKEILQVDMGDGSAFILKSSMRHCEIEAVDFVRAGSAAAVKEIIRRQNIPLYATETVDPTRDVRRYSWPVVILEDYQYEQIFHLEQFLPADTEPDSHQLEEVRGEIDKIWIDEVKHIDYGDLGKMDAATFKKEYEGDWLDRAHDHIADAMIYGTAYHKPGLFSGTSTTTIAGKEEGLTATKLKAMMDSIPAVSPRGEAMLPDYSSLGPARRHGKSTLMSDFRWGWDGAVLHTSPLVKLTGT